MPVEQGATCEFDRLRYGGQRNAPAPPHVADEFPGMTIRYVVQYLPDHDAGAFEGGFAVADQGIGHDKLPEFDDVLLAIDFGLHAVLEECALVVASWQVSMKDSPHDGKRVCLNRKFRCAQRSEPVHAGCHRRSSKVRLRLPCNFLALA